MIISLLFVICISIYAITIAEWQNNPEYIARNREQTRAIQQFEAPPYCIIPGLCIAFCFQFYFLQVVHTLK